MECWRCYEESGEKKNGEKANSVDTTVKRFVDRIIKFLVCVVTDIVCVVTDIVCTGLPGTQAKSWVC